MVPPAAPSIYGPLAGRHRHRRRRAAAAAAVVAGVLGRISLGAWLPGGAAQAQAEPPPPLPPAATSELARRTLAAGQAMERSGVEFSRQPDPQNRQRACSVFYLAQVAYARAVELGLDSAEGAIDRVESLKQSVGCGPSGGDESSGEPAPGADGPLTPTAE